MKFKIKQTENLLLHTLTKKIAVNVMFTASDLLIYFNRY